MINKSRKRGDKKIFKNKQQHIQSFYYLSIIIHQDEALYVNRANAR